MSVNLVLSLLLIACAVNAAADVVLLWGVGETDAGPGIEALAKTPERFVIFGSMIGLLIIPVWFLIAPYLARIPGVAGNIAFYSYLIYVAGVFAFHLCYAFVGLGVQANAQLEAKFAPLVQGIASYSFLASIVFTVALGVSGFTKSVAMQWYHYAALPLFTIIFFQMILGSALKSFPHVQSALGVFAMAVFFIGFMSLVRQNPALLGNY
ncbi:MAG: hypothetical protein AAF607_16340 [Pseudomonadota bacterium]